MVSSLELVYLKSWGPGGGRRNEKNIYVGEGLHCNENFGLRSTLCVCTVISPQNRKHCRISLTWFLCVRVCQKTHYFKETLALLDYYGNLEELGFLCTNTFFDIPYCVCLSLVFCLIAHMGLHVWVWWNLFICPSNVIPRPVCLTNVNM